MPGYTLATIECEEEANSIASNIMKQLWVPAPKSINVQTINNREISLLRIHKNYPNGLGVITNELIQEAVNLFKEMISSQKEQFLLHGDLHHYNIIKGKNTWLAIDPKGLIGEREYDIIQFLLNNLENKNIEQVIEKRINYLANELNLDKTRILKYGFAHAVLSTCWTIEDFGTHNEIFYKGIFVFRELLGS